MGIEIHLPADLREICDLTTLKLESGSFIEENLQPYYSDVLYFLRTSPFYWGLNFIYISVGGLVRRGFGV